MSKTSTQVISCILLGIIIGVSSGEILSKAVANFVELQLQ